MSQSSDLQSSDFAAFRNALQALYVHDDLAGFPKRAMAAATILVPSDMLAYTEIDAAHQRAVSIFDSHSDELTALLPAFAAYVHEHPRVQDYWAGGGGSARKVSDYFSSAEWQRTNLYNEIFRRFGLHDQWSVMMPTSDPAKWMAGLNWNRTRRTFSERERSLLDLLRPHLFQAYQNAEAVSRLKGQITRGIERITQRFLVVSPSGSIGRSASDQLAVELLSLYGRDHARRAGAMPVVVERWLRRHRAAMPEPLAVTAPLTLKRSGHQLTLRIMTRGDAEGVLLLMEETATTPADPLESGRVELPPYLRRTLTALLDGDSEKQAAIRLGISLHSLHQYVKVLYRRLGVTSRAELMARANQRGGTTGL